MWSVLLFFPGDEQHSSECTECTEGTECTEARRPERRELQLQSRRDTDRTSEVDLRTAVVKLLETRFGCWSNEAFYGGYVPCICCIPGEVIVGDSGLCC